MAINIDDLLPSAADMKKKMAIAEAEKASEYTRKQAAADAEKKALFDQLQKPSGVSDEERLKRAATIINRAVNNGMRRSVMTQPDFASGNISKKASGKPKLRTSSPAVFKRNSSEWRTASSSSTT